MQSSARRRAYKPGLIGASPITDAIVRVAQIDKSGTLRRCRPQVQLLPRTPFSPLCLSSYRASFVNSYSSVQVRPGAPSGLWCNNSISPCEGDGPGANPGFLTSHSLSGLSCRLSFNRMPPHESDHALLDGLGYSE